MKPYIVPVFVFGRSGMVLTALLILIVTVTAASNSVLGGSSILYHDVLGVYLKPYRKKEDRRICLLCGKPRRKLTGSKQTCHCCSMLECTECGQEDRMTNRAITRWTTPYICNMHGKYRAYKTGLSHLRLRITYVTLALMMTLVIAIYMKEVTIYSYSDEFEDYK
ncbi:unnamed protein product [Dibothriocephalus latus]|uniref:Uncharacterized protein n=1 Tax=Dibothriocephalus latus TaxID=60516 RepID=A0A3P7LWU5_DIBLA|nr:unnamed protein product [Dibothriocephalus latus]